MNALSQSILVPIIVPDSFAVIAYAEMLSKAYDKALSLLFFDEAMFQAWEGVHHASFTSKSFYEGVNEAIAAQDCVMVVWSIAKRKRQIQRCLSAARLWRIPYFFIPTHIEPQSINTVFLPISFLIEDREKAIWAKSLNRVFDLHLVLAQPNDKGSKALKNVTYVQDFLSKHKIKQTTIQAKASSFKLEAEIVDNATAVTDLVVCTASRDYGLDDLFFGPKELRYIRRTKVPIMMLNPRGDLYVLCGD